MTFSQIAAMEADMASIQRRAATEKAKPFYLRRDDVVERLRSEYRQIHRRWWNAKRQMTLDV